jgi:mannosyltransferase OCH1-like enzyme
MPHSFPKIIWQTHNYKKEWLPEHLRLIAGTWINLNPGWDYRYVDQIQRDETVRRYPEIYETYRYMMPVIQSDIWRFIVTYEEGGCYADMDSVCNKSLDYMLDGIEGDPEMVTVPVNNKMGNTHNYIVKAKSPLMKIVLDKIIQGNGKEIPNPTHAFESFVETAYSYPNVSKLFDAAFHSMDYKRRFSTKKHKINHYGKEMDYDFFVEKNKLDYRL